MPFQTTMWWVMASSERYESAGQTETLFLRRASSPRPSCPPKRQERDIPSSSRDYSHWQYKYNRDNQGHLVCRPFCGFLLDPVASRPHQSGGLRPTNCREAVGVQMSPMYPWTLLVYDGQWPRVLAPPQRLCPSPEPPHGERHGHWGEAGPFKRGPGQCLEDVSVVSWASARDTSFPAKTQPELAC